MYYWSSHISFLHPSKSSCMHPTSDTTGLWNARDLFFPSTFYICSEASHRCPWTNQTANCCLLRKFRPSYHYVGGQPLLCQGRRNIFSQKAEREYRRSNMEMIIMLLSLESLQTQSEVLGMGMAGNGNLAVWVELIWRIWEILQSKSFQQSIWIIFAVPLSVLHHADERNQPWHLWRIRSTIRSIKEIQ